MSQCEVSIEFAQPNRRYRGGETISGSVHVVAKQALTYDSITLTGFWRCHGYGLPVTKEFHGARIDAVVHLVADERHSFPFSFVAPSEPVTYHGSDLNFDHYVRVEVDFPKGKIQECTEQYKLGPGVMPMRLGWGRNGPGRVDSDMGSKQGLAFNLVMLFVCATSFLIAPIFGYFFSGILVLTWVHRLLFRSQLRTVVITTPSTVMVAGEDYTVTVSCTPRMSLSLKGIRVKLRCVEESTNIEVSGDGVGGITGISQEIYGNHNMFSQGVVIKAGQGFTTEISGTIPQTEAYSFATAYGDVWEEKACGVSWEIQVSISTRLFAAWTGRIPIQVVPPEFIERSSGEG